MGSEMKPLISCVKDKSCEYLCDRQQEEITRLTQQHDELLREVDYWKSLIPPQIMGTREALKGTMAQHIAKLQLEVDKTRMQIADDGSISIGSQNNRSNMK